MSDFLPTRIPMHRPTRRIPTDGRIFLPLIDRSVHEKSKTNRIPVAKPVAREN